MVPLNAVIVSADIEVFVNNVTLATSVPTLLDLVPFPITGLTSADFNSVPLLTRSPFDIRSSDIGNFVRIDVTSLMVEAQRLGLRDLQLRFSPSISFRCGRRRWCETRRMAWREGSVPC